MNSVGIDVSKGKSMIAVMRPFGEVVCSPFEVPHTASELSKLARMLKSLDGETRVVMEATGNYHAPIARLLQDAGLYVSVVNPVLIHDYGNNSWLELLRFVPEEDIRLMLKTCHRQYQMSVKLQTMLRNNLISLLDNIFPGINRMFSSTPRADGSEKWLDFVDTFWHCSCVGKLSLNAFTARYEKWCAKQGYHFKTEKAQELHAFARSCVGVFPASDTTKLLVQLAVAQLRATASTLATLKQEMNDLAGQLPEYPVVMAMFGVGPALGPQLIAEIGDVRRFRSKKSLIALAGIDAMPDESGQVDSRNKGISKKGSPALRRTLFILMCVYLQRQPPDEPVYQFLDRKRTEGKPYKVYMIAAASKFLRIYYAKVMAYLKALEA